MISLSPTKAAIFIAVNFYEKIRRLRIRAEFSCFPQTFFIRKESESVVLLACGVVTSLRLTELTVIAVARGYVRHS